VVLRGTARTLDEGAAKQVEASVRRIVEGVSASLRLEHEITWLRQAPVLKNDGAILARVLASARAALGPDQVVDLGAASMGSEDFAWMLLKKPGCYIWIGNGDGAGSCMVHNPGYDFNDDILPIGASYWATLVEQQLARQALPQAAE
jgi:hippurate hydrolase